MNLFSFTTRSDPLKSTFVKANSQKAGTFLICLLVALIWTAAAAELRTWTFSQDGQMKTSSGGVASFKKKGRIDAAFIRVETTNVVLLGARGEYLTVAETNLSDLDRDYVARAIRLNEPDTNLVELTAIERSERNRRKVEAAKVREDAAAKRHLAQIELEEADKLDQEAARLSGKETEFQSQAQAPEKPVANAGAVPDRSSAARTADGSFKSAAIADGAVQQLEQDIARIQLQAKEKRQRAGTLQKEAADLERTAGLLETNHVAGTPAPVNPEGKGSSPGEGVRQQKPHS